MRAQTALLAAAAVVSCLGVTQAIKCYSCIAGLGIDPPTVINDARCADPFDTFKMRSKSRTGINETDWNTKGHVVFDPKLLEQGLYTYERFRKLRKMPDSTDVKTVLYKVYCAKEIYSPQKYDTTVSRGFIAGPGVSNKCTVEHFKLTGDNLTLCACDHDNCNSASGLQLSFCLIAAAVFIGKSVCQAVFFRILKTQ